MSYHLTNHTNTLDAQSSLMAVITGAMQTLKPPPRLSVGEWADRERRLSSEASAAAGRWITSRAEYQRGIMDAISDPTLRDIVVVAGAQVGKTEMLLNVIGFHVHHDPAPILLVQPTLEMAQAFSKDRLAPMLRDTPALKYKVKDPRSRDANNTTTHKVFTGGHISLVGSNSAAGLASRPIRIVLCDEVDRYPSSAGSEGSPILLARKRSATFHNRKMVMVSTPTNKGASMIESQYEESDKRQYFVPCEDCGTVQTLKWSQVQWEKDRPETAFYSCEACGSVWDDPKRNRAVRKGEWVATADDTGIAGFHINGLYSPWTMMADAVRDFLVAKKAPDTLRVFVNTFLAETWEDQGETVGDIDFQSREDDWGEHIPDPIVVVTAGIDVQDDRLELEIVGWGRDEESWSLGYKTLYGDPSTPHLWNDLDNILKVAYTTESGRQLGIRAACIDSGGHYTQAVYNFVRPREGRRIFAIKGMGGEQRPLVSRPTKNNIGKIKLFAVGTFPIKELIFSRLRVQSEGAGYCHFPAGRSDEYYQQLANSEKIVTKYQKGFPRRDFVKTRTRNEALDCRVYAYAALCILSLNINAVADRVVNAPEPETQPQPQQPNPLARRPQRQGGFVNSWR
jgi:phage terminase large subunit GpA-like protein